MLVKPEPEAMAEGIIKLINNPQIRLAITQAAKLRVKQEYSLAAFRRKLACFYAKVEDSCRLGQNIEYTVHREGK